MKVHPSIVIMWGVGDWRPEMIDKQTPRKNRKPIDHRTADPYAFYTN